MNIFVLFFLGFVLRDDICWQSALDKQRNMLKIPQFWPKKTLSFHTINIVYSYLGIFKRLSSVLGKIFAMFLQEFRKLLKIQRPFCFYEDWTPGQRVLIDQRNPAQQWTISIIWIVLLQLGEWHIPFVLESSKWGIWVNSPSPRYSFPDLLTSSPFLIRRKKKPKSQRAHEPNGLLINQRFFCLIT